MIKRQPKRRAADTDDEKEEEERKSKKPRRSPRKRSVSLNTIPRHFSGPIYTADNNKEAGGRCSIAVLGPNSKLEMGSDADPNLPKGIKRAKVKYPYEVFVSGHLLNAEFGGNGKNAKNLTILTSEANANHKNFDNPIKKALDQLKKLYELLSKNFVDISTLNYGIRVSVAASANKWGEKPPDNYLCKELNCSASLVHAIDLDDLTDTGRDKLKAGVIKEAAEYITKIKNYIRSANRHGKVSNTR